MKQQSKAIRALLLITQLGISMMVPIVLCVFIGNFLQNKTGSAIWLFLFLFLGFGAAFRNVYLLLKPFYMKDKQKEDAELAYIENLKKAGKSEALKEKPKE